MKILVISNLYPPQFIGGYELICHGVVEFLRSRGHAVKVLTSNYHAEPQIEAGSVERSLRIHGMFGNPWLPIWKLHRLETHNNRVLRRVLREFKPDVVYCWNFSGLSKSMLFTLERSGLPTAFCVCDHWMARGAAADVWLKWWNRPQSKMRALAHLGARRLVDRFAPTQRFSDVQFRRVHFCSRFMRDFTLHAGCHVNCSEVIYCPVNTERFNAAVKPAHVKLRRLLYVGRLHEDKGVMTALRAMACLRGSFHGDLCLCGRGDEAFEAKLRLFVRRESLPVTLTSVDTPEQMAGVYAGNDALIFPSEWPEPFALTPLEAMASGLPVIGTTTGGSSELFDDGRNALTWTAGSPSELARQILELERDPELRIRIASEGQKEVRQRFSESVTHAQMEAFLHRTVEFWEHLPPTRQHLVLPGSQNDFPLRKAHERTCVQRFTVDGGDILEARIDAICHKVLAGIRSIVPEDRLEGVLLGGSYGRGEGGVYRANGGELLYNDLEFFVLLRGFSRVNEFRHLPALERLTERLSHEVGIEIELKILSARELRQSPITMAYHDLIVGHRRLWGGGDLLAGCEHHRAAGRIPRHEAARLLLNRCSGLLFALAKLRSGPLGFADRQFVARNHAKARLGLGDAVLTVVGQYHSSCRERARRLRNLTALDDCPWFPEVRLHHRAGMEFKLHPHEVAEPELFATQQELTDLSLRVWLWLESHRLDNQFSSAAEYAFSNVNKCRDRRAWRNWLINLCVLRTVSLKAHRYPRERLFHSLALLLWESEALADPAALQRLQHELRSNHSSFENLVGAYEKLWRRFN